MEKAHAEAKVRLVAATGTGEFTHTALFDTGASRSVMSEDLAVRLGWRPYDEGKRPSPLTPKRVADRIEIVGYTKAVVDICEVCPNLPAADFEVSRDLKEGQLIIGRPELDLWDIEFTRVGPRPRQCPVELGLGLA